MLKWFQNFNLNGNTSRTVRESSVEIVFEPETDFPPSAFIYTLFIKIYTLQFIYLCVIPGNAFELFTLQSVYNLSMNCI